MKLKYKKKKYKYISNMTIITIISFLLSIYLISYISSRCSTRILPVVSDTVRKRIILIINDSFKTLDMNDNLFTIKHYENNIISYNSLSVNRYLDLVNETIETRLKEFISNKEEKDKLSVPFGFVFDSSLLHNIGPKIMLNIDYIGDVESNIETLVKPYGINNSYIEVLVNYKVSVRITIPFVEEKVVITNNRPIYMDIILGGVPNSYISSYK